MHLILRYLIRANCFLFFSFTQVNICKNIQLMQICSLPAVASHQVEAWTYDDFCFPPLFFSFFFPSAASKARVIKAVWAREREGSRGREKKNEWKLPNEQKNAQTGLSTQTKAVHHKFAPSFFSSEQNFCQTDSTSQLTLSLPVVNSISDPQAQVHNIAAPSWPK